MSMSIYRWMIVYADNTIEIVEGDNVVDAVEYNAKGDWYSKGVYAVIRLDYA